MHIYVANFSVTKLSVCFALRLRNQELHSPGAKFIKDTIFGIKLLLSDFPPFPSAVLIYDQRIKEATNLL